MLITPSSLRLYRTCPRAYRHRYVDGLTLRDASSESLRFGTTIHGALEAYWSASLNGGSGEPLRDALAWLEANAQGEELARARAMIAAYAIRWEGDRLEPLAVEIEYRAPMIDPVSNKRIRGISRAGKIDAIARDSLGDVWIVEHKTSSMDLSPGSPYFQRLALDAQISHYVLGARALGYEPRGVIYDVLAKPKIARHLATPEADRRYTQDGRLYARQHAEDEDLAEYEARVLRAICDKIDGHFVRAQIVRFGEELIAAQCDDLANVRGIREHRKSGHWPRNADQCWRYGSRCDYWDLCSGQVSAEDAASRYDFAPAHSELTQEKSR